MDVVTFGETMVLFVPEGIGPLRFAERFSRTIGGAETNLAIGLARLGHEVGWFSRLGSDEFGKYVRNFVRGEGVDTSRVIFDDSHPTAVFFKERTALGDSNIYYYRKGSAASNICPDDLDLTYIGQARFLHVTGITPALSASAKDTVYAAIDVAKRNGVTVVFDPNLRRKLWNEEEARNVLLEIASRSDIILPGIEEGEFLTGVKDPAEIAKMLRRRGTSTVVVKLGEQGAFYDTGFESRFVDAIPVPQIIDTVGAGDAFAAGLLSGFLRGLPIDEAVHFGNQMGSYALTVPGDVEGLPDSDKLGGGKFAR